MTSSTEMVLEVTDLIVAYGAGKRRILQAVAGVSLAVARGETLGLVGESGCGKSSLARAVMQCPPPTSGVVRLCGEELGQAQRARLRQLRPMFQMLFQDPSASLNPRRSVGASIAIPLRHVGVGSRAERRRRVHEMMEAVGLCPAMAGMRPAQLSGGQCQRVQIARSLATGPRLLVCDEPAAALDVSIQAQILNLLADLRDQRGLTLLFISHDLPVVKHICDRVAVMYLGKLCEVAPVADLFNHPAHPYTRALLSAIPGASARRGDDAVFRSRGEIPSPLDPPSGCRYRTRCPLADSRCAAAEPAMREIDIGHYVACPASDPHA